VSPSHDADDDEMITNYSKSNVEYELYTKNEVEEEVNNKFVSDSLKNKYFYPCNLIPV